MIELKPRPSCGRSIPEDITPVQNGAIIDCRALPCHLLTDILKPEDVLQFWTVNGRYVMF